MADIKFQNEAEKILWSRFASNTLSQLMTIKVAPSDVADVIKNGIPSILGLADLLVLELRERSVFPPISEFISPPTTNK